jgi:hypothetical protein
VNLDTGACFGGPLTGYLQKTVGQAVPYLDCIKEIVKSGDRMAIAVKRADNQDNLDPQRLAKLPPEKRAGDDKYRRSIEMLTVVLK